VAGWEVKLSDYLEVARHAPFEWGRNDCCIFAAKAILAITGEDLLRYFPHKYTSEVGAMEAISKAGYRGIAHMLDCFLGPSMSPWSARRGDIVIADVQPGRLGAGVCVGDVAAFLKAPQGLRFLPLSNCLQAWTIGV
jgi:hypothetical protein